MNSDQAGGLRAWRKELICFEMTSLRQVLLGRLNGVGTEREIERRSQVVCSRASYSGGLGSLHGDRLF